MQLFFLCHSWCPISETAGQEACLRFYSDHNLRDSVTCCIQPSDYNFQLRLLLLFLIGNVFGLIV